MKESDTSLNVKYMKPGCGLNVKEGDSSLNLIKTDISQNVKEINSSLNAKEADMQ